MVISKLPASKSWSVGNGMFCSVNSLSISTTSGSGETIIFSSVVKVPSLVGLALFAIKDATENSLAR